MSYLSDPQPHRSARDAWRRREARQRLYRRRRLVALALVLSLIAGLFFGGRALVRWWQQPADQTPPPATSSGPPPAAKPLPFKPDRTLSGADLDGDGQAERIAVGPVVAGSVQVALVTGAPGKEQMLGEPLTLPSGSFAVTDLPRAQRLLVVSQVRPQRAEPERVTVGEVEAVKPNGGETEYQAWRLDKSLGFAPVDYYALAAPLTPPEPTAIMVDKGLNVLWYFEEGRLVQTSRVATGQHTEGPAPTAANQRLNYITPTGRFTVATMIPGVTYYRDNIPALDPKNPLGTRWIGFATFEGDQGHIWGIHGTNDPNRMGQWLSEGCIELTNPEVEALYERVKVGTPIVVQNSVGGVGP